MSKGEACVSNNESSLLAFSYGSKESLNGFIISSLNRKWGKQCPLCFFIFASTDTWHIFFFYIGLSNLGQYIFAFPAVQIQHINTCVALVFLAQLKGFNGWPVLLEIPIFDNQWPWKCCVHIFSFSQITRTHNLCANLSLIVLLHLGDIISVHICV